MHGHQDSTLHPYLVHIGLQLIALHTAPGGDRNIADWRNCNTTEGAFMYKPRMGDAVMFWAVDPSGTIDPHALHGGCPVIEGEKW